MGTLGTVNRRWRRLLMAALIVVASLVLVRCAFPGDSLDDQPGIVGTYVVNGVDPLDVEYSGTVTISPGGATDGYVIEWIVTGAIQLGTGTLTGDRFDVTWSTVTSGTRSSRGTATYTVGADGVLRGTKTVEGVDGTGTEEIFPDA